MARTYKVRLSRNGTTKEVIVSAITQNDAKRLAEAQNPGFNAAGCQELR